MKMCSPEQMHNFERVYKTPTSIAKLQKKAALCPVACNAMTYSHSKKTTSKNIELECQKMHDSLALANATFPYSHIHPLYFIIGRQKTMEKLLDHCSMMMRNTISIDIMPATSRVTVIQQHRRVTFLSQLADFGKDFYHLFVCLGQEEKDTESNSIS
jgi:hypothetical protein